MWAVTLRWRASTCSTTTRRSTSPGRLASPRSRAATVRGADSVEEFERQRAKIIVALAEIDADVVGLIEIENNVNDDAVIDLVAGLNDAVGGRNL